MRRLGQLGGFVIEAVVDHLVELAVVALVLGAVAVVKAGCMSA